MVLNIPDWSSFKLNVALSPTNSTEKNWKFIPKI